VGAPDDQRSLEPGTMIADVRAARVGLLADASSVLTADALSPLARGTRDHAAASVTSPLTPSSFR
jgi:hypothetical protein